jgi:hypothetical protein
VFNQEQLYDILKHEVDEDKAVYYLWQNLTIGKDHYYHTLNSPYDYIMMRTGSIVGTFDMVNSRLVDVCGRQLLAIIGDYQLTEIVLRFLRRKSSLSETLNNFNLRLLALQTPDHRSASRRKSRVSTIDKHQEAVQARSLPPI